MTIDTGSVGHDNIGRPSAGLFRRNNVRIGLRWRLFWLRLLLLPLLIGLSSNALQKLHVLPSQQPSGGGRFRVPATTMQIGAGQSQIFPHAQGRQPVAQSSRHGNGQFVRRPVVRRRRIQAGQPATRAFVVAVRSARGVNVGTTTRLMIIVVVIVDLSSSLVWMMRQNVQPPQVQRRWWRRRRKRFLLVVVNPSGTGRGWIVLLLLLVIIIIIIHCPTIRVVKIVDKR
mmetsp:Transcript_19228/g.52825  ORF Transcript_19228/g.52825 Transcript_19228/m.52825 type:complete len:228 (-) Transcript_19228:28-711(-)